MCVCVGAGVVWSEELLFSNGLNFYFPLNLSVISPYLLTQGRGEREGGRWLRCAGCTRIHGSKSRSSGRDFRASVWRTRTLPCAGCWASGGGQKQNDFGISGASTLPPALQLSQSRTSVMSPLFAKCKFGHVLLSFGDAFGQSEQAGWDFTVNVEEPHSVLTRLSSRFSRCWKGRSGHVFR